MPTPDVPVMRKYVLMVIGASLSAVLFFAAAKIVQAAAANPPSSVVAVRSPIRAVDLNSLRADVNSKRSSCGLSPITWTDDPISAGTPIKRIHIAEIRIALADAYMSRALPIPGVTDAFLTTDTPIKAVHFQELSAATSSLSCLMIVNAACGPASANSYPNAAAVNTAGLCTSGNAAPSAVSGAGPWSWICNGSGGGSNASCSATQGAPSSCGWTRIASNDDRGVPNLANAFLRAISAGVPEAGACSASCNTYPWLSIVNPPESPADGIMLAEHFGGAIPPVPPMGSVLASPDCTTATNGQVLAGLRNNFCTCMVFVTSTWRCNCP